MGRLEDCGWGTSELLTIDHAYSSIQELEEPKPKDAITEQEELKEARRRDSTFEASSNFPPTRQGCLFQMWMSPEV